jgi:hypothetical protein
LKRIEVGAKLQTSLNGRTSGTRNISGQPGPTKEGGPHRDFASILQSKPNFLFFILVNIFLTIIKLSEKNIDGLNCKTSLLLADIFFIKAARSLSCFIKTESPRSRKEQTFFSEAASEVKRDSPL